MARYRIGESPLTYTDTVTTHMFLGVAVFGVFAGIGFVIAGMRGRQRWMVFWGGGLVLSSIAYLLSRLY
jgi:hypothetical protein